jgi:hypothetical protein
MDEEGENENSLHVGRLVGGHCADRSTCCIGAAARSIDQKILQFKKYWSTYIQAALLESCVGTRVRTRRHAPTRTPEPDADRSSTIQLALCTDCVCVRIIDSMSSGMLDRKEPAAQPGLSLVCAKCHSRPQ